MSRDYEVTFYREIVGDNGHCRATPIEVLEIPQAATREAAIAAAIRRFEQEKGVLSWKSLATHYAVAERPA